MTLYHWLGIDAEPPEADEAAQYEETAPNSWTLIEDDGFITQHPMIPRQPTAQRS